MTKACVQCEGPLTGRQQKYCSDDCKDKARWRARVPDEPGSQRDKMLLHRYGITHADYVAILESQGGGCAICGKPEPPNKHHCVDHDHKTGVVRGILCLRCNLYVLGKLTLQQIEAAHGYLLNPPAVKALGREVIAPGKPHRRRKKRGPSKPQKRQPMKKVWGFE